MAKDGDTATSIDKKDPAKPAASTPLPTPKQEAAHEAAAQQGSVAGGQAGINLQASAPRGSDPNQAITKPLAGPAAPATLAEMSPLQRAELRSIDAENRPKGQVEIAQEAARIQPGVPNSAVEAKAVASPSQGETVKQAGPLSGPEANPPTNPDMETVFPGADQNLHGLPALPVDARHPASATQAATRPTANPGLAGGGAPAVLPEARTLEQRTEFQRLEARAKGANV